MSDSVYRVTEVIGTSSDSWEAAARNAVETAAKSIRDLRVAEATRFDVTIEDGTLTLGYNPSPNLLFKLDQRIDHATNAGGAGLFLKGVNDTSPFQITTTLGVVATTN